VLALLVGALSVLWLASISVGMAVGGCGEDGEWSPARYERACEGTFSYVTLAALGAGATVLLLLIGGLWAWRRRDAFALSLAGAAGAVYAVVLTLVAL
jgi:hypothetical protein